LEQPAKRLQQVARRCLERVYELEQRIFNHHLPVIEDRKHLQAGTPERGYFTAGYLQALKDVRDLIDEGEFPTKLNLDGGPRVAVPSTAPPPGDEHEASEQACLNCSESPAVPNNSTVPLCTKCTELMGDPRGVEYEKRPVLEAP
jgi:hypothetical protein